MGNLFSFDDVNLGSIDLLDDLNYRGDEERTLANEIEAAFEEAAAQIGVTDSLRKLLNKQKKVLLEKQQQFLKKDEATVKFKDKLTFCAGVWNIALTAFLAGGHPEWMPEFYTAKAVLLISWRWAMYYFASRPAHYFLFDFCYFVNLLVLLFLWVWPDSLWLFNVCFSFSMGPLLWAIPTWRNSAVFHSADKMTSLFIHLGPPSVLWNVRWHLSGSRFPVCSTGAGCHMSFFDASIAPLAMYLVWQVFYVLRVEIWGRQKVKERGYVTSFNYSMRHEKSLTFKICNFLGPNFRLPIFMLLQLIYTLVTMLPIKFIYESSNVHLAVYYLAFGCAVWNGANFYFEVFANRYSSELSELKKQK